MAKEENKYTQEQEEKVVVCTRAGINKNKQNKAMIIMKTHNNKDRERRRLKSSKLTILLGAPDCWGYILYGVC